MPKGLGMPSGECEAFRGGNEGTKLRAVSFEGVKRDVGDAGYKGISASDAREVLEVPRRYGRSTVLRIACVQG